MEQNSGKTAPEQATISHDGVDYTTDPGHSRKTHAELDTNGKLSIYATKDDFLMLLPNEHATAHDSSVVEGQVWLKKEAKLDGITMSVMLHGLRKINVFEECIA